MRELISTEKRATTTTTTTTSSDLYFDRFDPDPFTQYQILETNSKVVVFVLFCFLLGVLAFSALRESVKY